MKFWQWIADWAFVYCLAWILILLSPLWFPIWLAIKISKWAKPVDKGMK